MKSYLGVILVVIVVILSVILLRYSFDRICRDKNVCGLWMISPAD